MYANGATYSSGFDETEENLACVATGTLNLPADAVCSAEGMLECISDTSAELSKSPMYAAASEPSARCEVSSLAAETAAASRAGVLVACDFGTGWGNTRARS
jgi:hypothetical protein